LVFQKNQTEKKKFDYWFNAISKYNKELIYFSSIFANCDDWDKVCDLIVDSHQYLKQLIETKQNKKKKKRNINSTEKYKKKKKKKKKRNL
jgi:hypothetical protein